MATDRLARLLALVRLGLAGLAGGSLVAAAAQGLNVWLAVIVSLRCAVARDCCGLVRLGCTAAAARIMVRGWGSLRRPSRLAACMVSRPC